MSVDAKKLEAYFDKLWPICRSITGPGYRESLDILSELVPFEKIEFKSGEKVLDWTVPDEWHCRDAYIKDAKGNKHADFKKSNLHIMSYSIPFRGTLSLKDLEPHLYSLPEMPSAIPYLTSYYKPQWGFCLSYKDRSRLQAGKYEVVVDAELKPGKLTIGEAVLPGKTSQEILFSSYLCHPSLANNELSGPLVLAAIYQRIAAMKNRKYTYRFLITPETIGAIAYLHRRGKDLKKNLRAGFQITCIGDKGPFTLKRSRLHESLADRAAEAALSNCPGAKFFNFDPSRGSDERQYCSPGFNLPVASLMRTMYGHYAEYHSSLDNKNFIDFQKMIESVDKYIDIVRLIEANDFYINQAPCGEPQLGRRGLYSQLGGLKQTTHIRDAIMWLLNYSDGNHDLISIVLKSRLDTASVLEALRLLVDAKLLRTQKTKKLKL